MVFHLGAKVKDNSGFSFNDTNGLAKWPTPDRGVVVFKDQRSVEAKRNEFKDLCTRWLDQTI